MAIIEKKAGVIDERLQSEEFRRRLLASPVIAQKQKEAKELVKAVQKLTKK